MKKSKVEELELPVVSPESVSELFIQGAWLVLAAKYHPMVTMDLMVKSIAMFLDMTQPAYHDIIKTANQKILKEVKEIDNGKRN